MAAARLFKSCGRLTPRYCTLLRPNGVEQHLQKIPSLSIQGVRDYRGSNRDTRRRERNRQAKLRKREGSRVRVFDKKEFMVQYYEKELFAFKNRLQLHFQDESKLLSALTHESYEPEESGDHLGDRGQPNPKLALLGHSFISRHITEYLFLKYPALPIDGIRNLCEFLTKGETIVKIAEEIGLPDLIRIEHDLDTINEEKHLVLKREDVISDAFLALIGAIYIDQGFEEAGRFVQDFIIPRIRGEELEKLLKFDKPQTLLENFLLANGQEKPVARLIRESGSKTHLPVFVVAVYCGEEVLAEAASWNLEKAKHEAMTAAVIKFILRDTQWEPKLPSLKEGKIFPLTAELGTKLSL